MLFLLRVIFKPVDVSFLNGSSSKFKKYLVNFHDISTEKIVFDFDILKNQLNVDLGQVKLKEYNNISNIRAENVSVTIKITDLVKKKYYF